MRSRSMFTLPFVVSLLAGCPDPAPQNVVLKPEGEQVILVTREPNPSLYDDMGEIRAAAMGIHENDATQSARFELRNKAAQLGATMVLVERSEGEPGGLRERVKVILIGRSFKPKDRTSPAGMGSGLPPEDVYGPPRRDAGPLSPAPSSSAGGVPAPSVSSIVRPSPSIAPR